ncbi:MULTISPECIES: phage/plasmid primase, P4 family [unclassified Gemella]|uniref:DNA primase family protein n=1 Tax=unclassified Gemella TaxID=2624949 RepID=UPI0015D0CB40|nr:MULTISPECIES: phage/plasmid primase, P4 family [unclassified Gemella]MBF0709744.1 DNA primase [Gemella sp. GL1.1]NYS27088.1 DNA primase [Gemella sp. GL1]
MYVEFLPNQKHAKKGADISDSHDHFKDAGYILNENEVVVDIDSLDKEVIKKLINTFDIKTQIVWTTRGAHLYFKRPDSFKRAKGICALGFEVEFKTSRNTYAVTIKQKGELRQIENEGIREDLPLIFSMNKKFLNLNGYAEGDGRNQSLFTQRAMLAQCKGWKSILRFINYNIFSEPMKDDELETILREGVTFDSNEVTEIQMAELIKNKYKIVQFNNAIYYRYRGDYKKDEELLKRIIKNECGSQKTYFYKEVRSQLDYMTDIIPGDKIHVVKFKNGILKDGKFIEIDYVDFTPYSIPIKYNPNAKSVKEIDDYLKHLTDDDKDYRKLVLEIIAHALITDPEFKRLLAMFSIFVGDGGNGKGTLLTIIRRILGAENTSGLSIKNLADERYIVTLKGILANLGDDIQDAPINNEQMKVLKNISSCDFVAVRELFKQSENTVFTTTLIFTSNHILKTFEKGESYKRRVQWLPMYGKPKKKDPHFITKLTTDDALEYWIMIIIEAYKRLYSQGHFTKSERVTKWNEEYHEENNSTIQFLSGYTKQDILGKKPPEIYTQFETWVEENGVHKSSAKLLKDTICAIYDVQVKLKKINKKPVRVYTEIEE